MKEINVYIHFDKPESKEMKAWRKANFFMVLAEIKKERLKDAG